MLGIGIIGAGFFGESHAKAINDVPSAQLIAASRRDKNELKKFTQKFNIRGYTDYKNLLSNTDINAVVISTPHHYHTKIAIDAFNAGKHVLLEKPMATNPEECDSIIEAALSANKKLMIGHSMQFIRSSVVAKEIIESGELGDIAYGTGTIAKQWQSPNRQNWHYDPATGGGMLMTSGIHYIDLLTWLFNSKVLSVKANLSTQFHEQEANDAGMLFLQYENGVTGVIISTGYKTGIPKFTAELTCTHGMLKVDMFNGVYIGRNDEWIRLPESISEDTEHEALVSEWKTFAKSIETNTAPQITGEYGKHMLEIIQAAERSSEVKKEIWIHDMVSVTKKKVLKDL